MRKSQDGFIEIVGALFVLLLVVGFFFALFFVRFSAHTENVSGIVYNTQNDKFISGNTSFSIRAGENTYVSEENKSSYCLPPNSPYKDLVNRAAADKRIKVQVETSKYFAVQLPWTCYPNVKVTEVK